MNEWWKEVMSEQEHEEEKRDENETKKVRFLETRMFIFFLFVVNLGCFVFVVVVESWVLQGRRGWRRNSGSGEGGGFIGASFEVSLWQRLRDSSFWNQLFLQASVDFHNFFFFFFFKFQIKMIWKNGPKLARLVLFGLWEEFWYELMGFCFAFLSKNGLPQGPFSTWLSDFGYCHKIFSN